MSEEAQVKDTSDRWIAFMEVGEFVYSGFVICRGCGAAVPMTMQPALRAHVMTCEPIRRAK